MRLWLKKAAIVIAALCIPSIGALLFAQTGPQLRDPIIIGHLIATPQGSPPTTTTCTLASGSTDMAGSCTATAAAAAVTFGTPYTTAPFCVVVDSSATPVVVYTVSTTAITISATTSGHVLNYNCIARTGG